MPKNIIESISHSCVKAVFRTRANDLAEAALNEGHHHGVLLLEEFSSQDAQNLQDAAEELKKLVGQLETRTADAGEGWKQITDSLKGEVDALDAKQIAQMALSGETKKLAKAAADYTKRVQRVASETAAILDATEQMRKNLKNFESEVGDKKGETIGSLSTSVEKFPDVSKLDKGVASVYKVPDWFESAWSTGAKAAEDETEGGFFKKAMSFIGGLFKGAKEKRMIEPAALASAIKATPFEKLMDLNLQAEIDTLTDTSESSGEETAELASAGVESTGEEAAPAGSEEEPPPASDEESDAEVRDAGEELESAAEEAVTEPTTPADAVSKALDDWASGLSASSQKSLAANDRLGSLKTGIATSLEKAADAVASEVATAVQAWRGENEEALIRSKRFAKSNFDSLEELIPQIASTMIKQTAESRFKLTKGMVHRSVYKYLDRNFKMQDVLVESNRWEKLAGIRRK